MKKNCFIGLIILWIIFCPVILIGQVTINYTKGQKDKYNLNDEIGLSIMVTTRPQACLDGMKRTKLYISGIEITEQSEWQEVKKGLWQKKVDIRITGNNKGFGMLTIHRKSEEDSFIQQVKFYFEKVENNG
jgi:hypothetical protein